ncbi:MAG: redoxin domain-containing protein [Gemmataceae bacterium]|nr:redoxin domain-containing protein [Gemmataceae bacterium]
MLLRTPLTLLALVSLSLPAVADAPKATDAPPQPERLWYQAAWLRPLLEQCGPGVPRPESVRMLSAIHAGSMGPGDGWFGPSGLLHNWDWLRKRLDSDRDGKVTRQEFRGPPEFFERLDRDGDGALTPDDFDWSPKSSHARQMATVNPWFNRADSDSNGQLSKEEWAVLFDRLAKGKDHLTPEDLRQALFPPSPSKEMLAKMKAFMPKRETLLRGLLNNELGSPYEGPRVGQAAPDFTLPTHDGKQKIALSDYRGKKPVVLIFGNFT